MSPHQPNPTYAGATEGAGLDQSGARAERKLRRGRRSGFTPWALAVSLVTFSAACENRGDANASSDVPEPPVASAASPPEIAATLAGKPITLAEVDAQVMQTDMAAMQQLYDLRERAVKEIAENRLLDAEAKKQGITRAALLAKEIDAKVTDVTDAEIQTFYDQNKEAVGEQTIETIGPRIRTFLTRQKATERREEYLSSLREAAGFELFLDPPRRNLAVAPNEPARGPAQAPVTIVEYSDFECPFCSRVVPTLYQLIDDYGDKIRLVYRDYPLAFHPNAQLAAEAAQCAHDQGKFWDYHNKLFENQKALDRKSLDSYATELELDADSFGSCLNDRAQQASVMTETQQASAYGVTGTPAFFINGRFVSGALPIERFKEVIDDELARKGEDASGS